MNLPVGAMHGVAHGFVHTDRHSERHLQPLVHLVQVRNLEDGAFDRD